MNPEQAAAFINAQTTLANIQLQGMLAENNHRANCGNSPAYGASQFIELEKVWEPILGYNAITQLFTQANNK
jgi:hypothetical protein